MHPFRSYKAYLERYSVLRKDMVWFRCRAYGLKTDGMYPIWDYEMQRTRSMCGLEDIYYGQT